MKIRLMGYGLLLPFLTGLIITTLLYLEINSMEKLKFQQRFNEAAQHEYAVLYTSLLRSTESVESIADFYRARASEYVSRKEFRLFVEGFLKRFPAIKALSWNPRIKASERNQYISKAVKDGFKDFQITELNAQGEKVKATSNNDHVMVYYIEPYSGNESALGFDIASHQGRMKAINKAIDSGHAVITERIKLVQGKNEQYGFLLLKPIYKKNVALNTIEKKRSNFIGMAVGVFKFNDIVTEAFKNKPKAGLDMIITDESAAKDKKHLYYHSSRTRDKFRQPKESELLKFDEEIYWQTNITLGGRQWSFKFTPAPHFYEQNQQWRALITLLIGFAITILLTLYLLQRSRNSEKLVQSNNKLLQEINQRIEIEKELEIEKNKAEAANQAKSQFLANMSHELRTPMHAIMSFASLGLKKIDNPNRTSKYFNNIRTSGIRLTNLLNNLLDISKLESGKMTVDFNEQDITTLIEQAINDVISLANDKNIQLNYNSKQPFDCMIDNALMMQVMINLLSNAIKFSPENSAIDIEVAQSNQLINNKQQDIIEIVITDEGLGIPEDEQESIFDKFIQSSKTKSGAGGTGLGLSITKEIIDLHHGKIWAKSPPYKRIQGTAFYIQFPVLQGIPSQISFTNIQDTILSHQEWIYILEDMYKTKKIPFELPNSIITNENLCSLGQWINSGAISSNQLDELKIIHKEFHVLAGECVGYCEMGNYAIAKEKRDKFRQVSNNMILMLESLKPES